MAKLENRKTMWAEQKTYVYDGEGCEQHHPQWYAYAEGDKDSDTTDTLELAAATFPPGTKVVVSEPVCPNCNMAPSRSHDPLTFIGSQGGEVTEYRWTCGCNFDWRAWAEEQYS